MMGERLSQRLQARMGESSERLHLRLDEVGIDCVRG